MKRLGPVLPIAILLVPFLLPRNVPAQDQQPGWEIFSPSEEAPKTETTLDPEDDPGLPKPKYSLDELTSPSSQDPDVYIRFSPGAEESVRETVPEPTSEADVEEPHMGSAAAEPDGVVSPARLRGTTSDLTAGTLSDIENQIPVVNTYAEYQRALANRTPEIIFEGKRWVYSELESTYVDPRFRGVEEARRLNGVLPGGASAAAVPAATGAMPLQPQPWYQPAQENLQPLPGAYGWDPNLTVPTTPGEYMQETAPPGGIVREAPSRTGTSRRRANQEPLPKNGYGLPIRRRPSYGN